jgi:hypothetical protein
MLQIDAISYVSLNRRSCTVDSVARDRWRQHNRRYLRRSSLSELLTLTNSVARVRESELYRLSDRLLTAKLVATFAARGVSRSQRGRSSTVVISVS